MNPIDRGELLRHTWEILMVILFQPKTQLAILLYLTVGGLALAIALAKAHGLASAGSSSIVLGLFCGAFCVFAMVEIAALMQMFALPYITNTAYRLPALIGTLLAAFLLMIVPFTRIWFRSGYGATVTAWILALVVGTLGVFGMKQVYDPKPASPAEAPKGFHSLFSQAEKELKSEFKAQRELVEPPAAEP